MRITIAVTITTINNYWTRLITLDEKLDLHVSNSSCNPPIGAFATDTMWLWTSSAIFSSCNKTVKLLVFSARDIAVPFYSILAQSILIIDIGKDSFQIRLTGGLRPMRDEEMFWMKNVVF